MKKTLIYIICIFVIICTLIISKIYSKKSYLDEINQFNVKYEKYLDTEITGTEIATIINQAVNDNDTTNIIIDGNGKYKQKDKTTINIEVKITEFDKEKIYSMETLYGGGMSNFVKYYGQIPFRAVKVEYNQNKTLNYILFEQVLQ